MKSNAICAIATAKGSSALGIIRVSGEELNALLSHLFTKKLSKRVKFIFVFANPPNAL